MALYIHGPLRCKNLLGRIPNPHSRHALAAPQPTHPRRGRSCTGQQHRTPPQHRQENAQHRTHAHDQTTRRHPPTHAAHTHTAQIRHPAAHAESCAVPAAPHDQPPDSTKARPTTKPDRLFLLHDGTGHRPADTIGKNHTARPPPMLPAASTFRRGDHPQIRQGEHHQHDHSPTPSKSHTEQRPALEASRRPLREQQPPHPRPDRPRTSRQAGIRCTRPCDGKAPGGHRPARTVATPRPPANLIA